MRWYAEWPITELEAPGPVSGQTQTPQKLAMLQQCGTIIMVLNTNTSAASLIVLSLCINMIVAHYTLH